MIDERVKLIAITHVPTNGGLVNPAAAIGAVARAAGVPYLLDACQSVGQTAGRRRGDRLRHAVATGRKFLRGPRGTGFLYVRRTLLERLDPPFLDLHAARWTDARTYELRPDARRFENWESERRRQDRAGRRRSTTRSAGGRGDPGARPRWPTRCAAARRDARRAVHDLGAQRCGIVTFTVDGRPPTRSAAPGRPRINVTVTTRAGTLLDMQARGLTELVRASVHYYNDHDDLDRLVERVERLSRS